MKFVEFPTWFESGEAQVALLSTFNFDPLFFEKRLLRSSSLARASRILVLMDAREWRKVCNSGTTAREINSRYLVIPVSPPNGVFHSKLHVLFFESGVHVLCGSNNLTKAGCTDNLELVSRVPVAPQDREAAPGSVRLAVDALGFFRQCLAFAQPRVAKIGRHWLDDLAKQFPWLTEDGLSLGAQEHVQLVHSLNGGIWKRLHSLWANDGLRSLWIISPYFDSDLRLVRRVREHWPKCKIEITSQQISSNLPANLLHEFKPGVELLDISRKDRRLHGKLLAWETKSGGGFLSGSANFTSAAFDGANIEASLLIPTNEPSLDALFDSTFRREPIAPDEFESGHDEPPELEEPPSMSSLRADSAILDENDYLHVEYSYSLNCQPDHLSLAIRTLRDFNPLQSLPVPKLQSGTTMNHLPESVVAQFGGAVTASLAAEIDGVRHEGTPTWIVQQARLTREFGDGSRSDSRKMIEETGDGLPEFLEELGKSEGHRAVIDYLTRLLIRFYDGTGNAGRIHQFVVRVRDPFRSDTPAEWLKNANEIAELEEAIYDFVDRHEMSRLRKHADHPNINGIDNFLDIFVTMIRLLYVYYERGCVKRGYLVGNISRYVEIATVGFESEDDSSPGYLATLATNLRGDKSLLRTMCQKANFAGHLRAALLVAQMVRWRPNDPYCSRLRRDCLPEPLNALHEGLKRAGWGWPDDADTVKALRQYAMLSDAQLGEWQKELAAPS